MTTFFPGPSQVYPQVKQFLADAYDSGILSISHRSSRFNALSAETIGLLRNKLAIPENYTVLYTSSATECWEIIAQSITRKQSLHAHSGAFGEKWFQYAKAINPNCREIKLGLNESLLPEIFEVREEDEIICLTQNETSNATCIGAETMAAIRGAFPNKLIAFDCTSSMAGIQLPFSLGDIWFASVQKCFGLPAGLGIMILSPSAINQIHHIGEVSHFNSAITMLRHMEQFQTSCTPNVLGIYLMNRVLQMVEPIEKVEQKLVQRMKDYESIFTGQKFKFLITNPMIRSRTVLAIESTAENISQIKEEAQQIQILLGSGYGQWKASTFRIANFPAHSDRQVSQLLEFLKPRVS